MGSGQITLKLPYGGRGDISKQVRGSEDFFKKKKMATPRQHVKKYVFFSKRSYLQPDVLLYHTTVNSKAL